MSGFADIVLNVNNLAATIRMATPIALAAMGGAFSERSGVVNIGIEGMMLTGAFCGVLGSYFTGSPWLGVLWAVAGGGLVGALLAVFAIRLKADHVVTGVGINIPDLVPPLVVTDHGKYVGSRAEPMLQCNEHYSYCADNDEGNHCSPPIPRTSLAFTPALQPSMFLQSLTPIHNTVSRRSAASPKPPPQ